MRKLSTTEKTRMTSTQVESFNDTCIIHSPTFTQDSLGERTATWTNSSSISCGFNPSNAVKNYKGEIISLDCDAVLRLSITETISVNHEVTVRSVRYKVNGITQGNSVNIITLKRSDAND
jgi:hypothetical protein